MFSPLSFTWIFPWEAPKMFLRSRECELESHQPPVATSRQRLRWRGGSGCDTDDWWCCTTVATGEKRHWRRRYRHRFDVGITIDVFRHSFDATFPPFWLCLVIWKDVVLQRRRLHRSRHTSGVICIVVKASYQAPFAVPFQAHFRSHTRHRLQHHFKCTSGAVQAPYQASFATPF